MAIILVYALFIIANQPAPPDHATECPLDDPAARQNLEAVLVFAAAYDLGDEVEIAGFVHEPKPIIGTLGEQMPYPRPALADGIEDRLCTCAIRDVGRSQLDHQQAAIGIDCDVAFAPDNLLPSAHIRSVNPTSRQNGTPAPIFQTASQNTAHPNRYLAQFTPGEYMNR